MRISSGLVQACQRRRHPDPSADRSEESCAVNLAAGMAGLLAAAVLAV